jgi:hypothetical protein
VGKGTECWSLSMLDPLILYILASCMIILAGMAATTSHMRTIKEQAAEVRAAGLRRFVADRRCRHGHLERRADGKGMCIACNYLRHSAPIS